MSVRSLPTLLLLATVLRLVAALFAGGYMASDDHFQVVEIAADWLRGNPVWLSGDQQFYRSLLYPGFHYGIMAACHGVGLTHPEAVMTTVRILLALLSLWAVAVTYRYGELVGGRAVGWVAGLLVAAHAVMPYVAVRSLVETAALPFLLYSLYRLDGAVRGGANMSNRVRNGGALVGGLVLGLAIVLRLQVAAAALGTLFYLCWKREGRVLLFGFAGALIPLLLQGAWDFAHHGEFLGSFAASLRHNRAHAFDYIVGPWYRYLLLIAGVFVPPFGFLVLTTMVTQGRRLGLLFWTTAMFVLVHSLIPGKQERFLLPVFPLLALLAAHGIGSWSEASPGRRRWARAGWILFASVNVPLLLIALFHYGQRGRIEPLVELYEQGGARWLVVDCPERHVLLPIYYFDGGLAERGLPRLSIILGPGDEAALGAEVREHLATGGKEACPSHAIVFARSDEEFARRRDSLAANLSAEIEVISHTEPSLVDRLLRALNPKYNYGKESWLTRLHWPEAPAAAEETD